MISKELEAKVRLIQIYSDKIVRELLAGEYKSVFKGEGIEFDEVRMYQAGDEVRSIDWNVTARTGETHVKRYIEERELNLFFLVDLSASGLFGGGEKTKNETAAELCALLAFSAIKNNDKAGLIIFTDRVELFIPPAKGSRHVLMMIRKLLEFEPCGRGTDITLALDYFGHVARKASVVFLVSDFQDSGFEDTMRVLKHRHDLIAVPIIDRREISMPSVGLLELRDLETGDLMVCDTGSARVRERFEGFSRRRLEELNVSLTEMGVDQIKIFTDEDIVNKVALFFRARERRLTGEVMR